jgi:RHS repeat-associated protein
VSGTYTIPATNNRVTAITGTPARTYTFNTDGDDLSYSNITLAYNDANRMSSATVGSTTTDYVYNALGQRVKKTNGTASTVVYFVYDEAGHLLGEYSSTGALIEETVWLGDTPVATLQPVTGGVGIYYIHADHLNAPQMITRATDNGIMWRWDKDPYGSLAPNQNPSGGTFVYNLGFPGQYYDVETGLFYNYFRSYDPQTGRYVESDPIGLAGGSYSTYAYAAGNPISNYDPSGLLKRGPGVGNQDWQQVQQAENKIRNELKNSCSCHKDGSANGCIPCDMAGNLLNILDTRWVTVESLDIGEPVTCGNASTGSNITLGPVAFMPGHCTCLASTLYHEALHVMGLDHEDTASGPGITTLENKCMGNLCKISR